MTKEELMVLARATAQRYELDPALVCAICEQESAWNPWALRYEPGFQAKYISPLAARKELKTFGASLQTEIIQRSCSFGLMQVMGQVARAFGFAGAFLTELCDPNHGLEYGCKKLKHALEEATGDQGKALESWTGGRNHAFPAEVLARK